MDLDPTAFDAEVLIPWVSDVASTTVAPFQLPVIKRGGRTYLNDGSPNPRVLWIVIDAVIVVGLAIPFADLSYLGLSVGIVALALGVKYILKLVFLLNRHETMATIDKSGVHLRQRRLVHTRTLEIAADEARLLVCRWVQPTEASFEAPDWYVVVIAKDGSECDVHMVVAIGDGREEASRMAGEIGSEIKSQTGLQLRTSNTGNAGYRAMISTRLLSKDDFRLTGLW